MAQTVADNGLQLDHDTATNGDCGPDAILRNIERLQVNNIRANQLLRHLGTHGRESALLMLRLMLVVWVTSNKDVEIVPGVSLSAWVGMEGYASLCDYVASMRTPRTWADTPMLVAACGAQFFWILPLLRLPLPLPTPTPAHPETMPGGDGGRGPRGRVRTVPQLDSPRGPGCGIAPLERGCAQGRGVLILLSCGGRHGGRLAERRRMTMRRVG